MGMSRGKREKSVVKGKAEIFGEWLFAKITEIVESGKVNQNGPTIVTVQDEAGRYMVTVFINPGDDGVFRVTILDLME